MSARPQRGLGAALSSVARDERRRAVRALLKRPLQLARHDPDGFAGMVRHRGWLQDWFAEQTGWGLEVDRGAGFARLRKVPARCHDTRPPRVRGRPPLDRRRYTLLCLVLAALEDCQHQTTLVRVAELVQELSAEEQQLEPYDGTLHGERRALVDALRYLVDLGLLKPRDGSEERYIRGQQGDTLYDINDRLLGHLLCAPIPPSLAGDPEGMTREPYADTEQGRRRQARHRVFRRLLDDPVVYYEDLDQAEFSWLDHSRGFVYQQLEERAGLVVERRREGLAAVDPEGQVTDEQFPGGGSTVKHAALLLAEQLVARRADDGARTFTDQQLVALTAGLIQDYAARCGWSKQYLEAEAGARRLAGDALALLEGFDLVVRQGQAWQARPALARFAPAAPAWEAP